MDEAAEAQLERDLKDAKQLRKQAAKLTNIGINSGSDLLTVKAKQLKERAAKIEEAARPVHKERSGEIRLANSGTHAKVLIAVENLTVTTPPGDPLFRIEKLHIFQGDRIVLLGRNGAGKSQFVKLLLRAIGRAGLASPGIKVSPSIVLGYTDQEMSQLPTRGSPRDYIGALQPRRSADHRAPRRRRLSHREADEADHPAQLRPARAARAPRAPAHRAQLLPDGRADQPRRHHRPGAARERDPRARGDDDPRVSHDRSFVRAIGTRFLEIRGKRLVEVDDPEQFFREMAAGAPGLA